MSEPVALDRALLDRFPLPHIAEDSDKEDRGRLLVIAGSRELAGAALLAGIAGLRAGAGKLQIASAQSNVVALSVAVPEARVIGCEESEDGCLADSAIPALLERAKGAHAVAIGCGLENGPGLDRLLDALLASAFGGPLVLDAAVLSCLAPRAESVRGWEGGAILLPHAGEMAALLECGLEDVAADPLGSARRASGRYGAVALVKGAVSYVAAPDGRAFRFEGGGVGLATSGSGDVLAGIVGGLCARGADPLTATLWGVWLHGEAGRILTSEVGRVGFLARELPELVPGLMGA